MSLRAQLRHGLRSLLSRGGQQHELTEEIEHYLAEAAAAHEARGLSSEEARRAARLEMGSRTSVSQQVQAVAWETRLEAVAMDLRRAARRLRRSPGFTAVTVVTLALGIGAATAIFSIVRPTLLEPLPYPDADRLVAIADAGVNGAMLDVTFGTHRELAARSRTLQVSAVTRPWQPTLSGSGEAERLTGQSVSAAYFHVLGVPPIVGRDFSAADDRPRAAPVAIIADSLWKRRFGGDRGIVGRTITLDGVAVTVVGVMPRSFENIINAEATIWRPLGYDPSLPADGREWGHHLQLLARLSPGVDLEQTRQELNALAHTPIPAFSRPPYAALRNGFVIVALQDRITALARPALRAVIMAAALLLLIAVVNVVNLLLARGVERRQELATCTAFGASRVRLVTPWLAEGFLLAAAGGALGVALAYAIVGTVVTADGLALPRVEAIRVDRIALAFAAALSAGVGLAAGYAAGGSLWWHQHNTAAPVRVTTAHQRLRRGLIAAEVAIALVLLVGAGLLVRTVRHLLSVPPGFRPEGVLTLQVQTSGPRYREPDALRRYFEEVRSAAGKVPGVLDAALSSQLPLTGDADLYGIATEGEGAPTPQGPDRSALRYTVSSTYLDAMHVPLVSGRNIEEGDRWGGTPVVLVSASLVRHRFGGRDPIGQRLRIGSRDGWYTVVGVAGDVKQSSLAMAAPDAFYVAQAQSTFADRAMWLVVRTGGNPMSVEPEIRRAIRAIDPDQPVLRVATLEQRVAASAGLQRVVMLSFNIFAGVALLLAAIGIYAVLAGGVVERTREFGVRAALGATRGSIVVLVARHGAAAVALGSVIGLGVAAAASRGLTTLLYGVTPLDGFTYGSVLALVGLAAAIGALIPTWRAARIPPAIALQSE